MMEFLHMGGYAGYVWTSYGLSAVVLVLNIIFSLKKHKAIMRRLKRLHNEANS